VLDGIDQFDVSDRTGELANQSSDALVPFASHTNGPFDGSVASYLAFPLGADLRKVIGPDEACSAAIGAMHHDDVGIGKIDSRVHRTDGLIIPLGNFAEEDFRQSIGSKFNFRVDSGDVVGRNDCSEHGGNIQDLEFRILQLFVSHWHVARAEIDGACGDLTDSAAATNGLVVDLNSWMR